MKEQDIILKLPEGNFKNKVLMFDNSDKQILKKVYTYWRNLCNALTKLNARKVNLPEGLSETAFCLEMNCVRIVNGITGTHSSFDAYNPKTNKRIQIKASSIESDLTSFGPNSVWDELYFLDFYRDGKWNGKFDIYLIPNELIYGRKVNKSQTLKQQQIEKRRPRITLFQIIKENKIKPLKTGNI